MSTQQTVWPGFPLSSPYGYTVPRPPYPDSEYAGVLVPWWVTPYFTDRALERQKKRTFFLDISVFDLVDAHKYLSLTDPKLLGWYLSLCPEDRKIIQDEGGLNLFLQRHPALELSLHHVYVKSCQTKHQDRLQHAFQTASSSPGMQHQRAQTGSQLNRRRQQKSSSTSADVSPSQSEWDSIERDLSPHYFSFDSDGENSISLSAELQQVSCRLKDNPTKAGSQDPTVKAAEDNGDESDGFHSIMEDDKGILICLSSPEVKTCNSGVPSGEALASSRESVIQSDSTESCPVPGVSTCEAGVGTEPAPCVSSNTQTEDPQTDDKHVITEVHIADLDYLTEEFIKLKLAQDELREQKRKSSGCRWRKECECVQRAQQAELGLLALQYSMCRQHCWRLHCTAAEGGALHREGKTLPANIGRVLQKLDSDFNQMRDQIVAGVPLEHLKPLSVDCEKISSGELYIPAQMIGDVLGNVPSRVQETQGRESGDRGSPEDPSRSVSEMRTEDSTGQRAVPLSPQDTDTLPTAPEDEQRTAVSKELSTCEAWYDAEEDLQPAETAAGEKSHDSQVSSSMLCVSNLPAHGTERDVKLCFEKYQPSEVSISTSQSDLSVAIVIESGAQSAEAAARELNGCNMQGRTLHVEHINRASVRGPGSSQSHRPEASSSQRKQVTQPPPGPSGRSRKVVCISPSAKGTFVPQHFGTMGSFDTLMAELTQRHPEAGRQSIMDALIQLKARHRGALSGLPLRTIRDMASELLTPTETPT